jgi:hypothetical protein
MVRVFAVLGTALIDCADDESIGRMQKVKPGTKAGSAAVHEWK